MSRYVSDAYPISRAADRNIITSLPSSGSNYTACDGRNVAYVVLHYTGNSSDTAKANCQYFAGGSRAASAHYFVDDSSIYQSVKAKDRAWAVGGTSSYKHPHCRNANSISIEMCCSGGYKVSPQTEANAAELCAELCRYIGIDADDVDTYVLRHWDVWAKDCPSGWTGINNSRWTGFKAKVKALLKGDMDMEQINELKSQLAEIKAALSAQAAKYDSIINEMGAEIAALKAANAPKMIYNYADDNIPEWARATVKRMVGNGIIRGDEEQKLGLTDDKLWALVVMDRLLGNE